MADNAKLVRCDACPVLCRIRPGRAGACDRYANEDGRLVRVDPLVLTERADARVPFLEGGDSWRGEVVRPTITGIGAGTRTTSRRRSSSRARSMAPTW